MNITRKVPGLTSESAKFSIRVLSKVTNKLLKQAIAGISWISIVSIVGNGLCTSVV